MLQPRIFVQIASYRDYECQWTVKSLFDQATHPERIQVGICWQFDPDLDSDCFIVPYPFPAQVRTIEFHPSASMGVCWARHQAQKLYGGEEYVLMIDSHMRFVEGWDEILMDDLKKCVSPKSLLTHYPPAYTPPNDLESNPLLTVQGIMDFNSQGNIRGQGVYLNRAPERPLRGAFIAAGFLFSYGSLVTEVPYDPYLYFDQEEISMAVRFYTHGWDVCHPTVISVFHCYYSPHDPNYRKPLHWEDKKDWGVWHLRANERFHHIVGHAESTVPEIIAELETYGLGNIRSLGEFEEFTGICFKQLKISEKTTALEFITELNEYR